ncbi:MAG: lycopene cyclase domain-containing protein [Bacteroidales bacterium]|nr:lycopene cyclase domain-containing protein [Bacteroidales bacterium]
MDNWLYVFINLGAISIPFLAGFDRRLRFDKQWKFLFPAMLLTMVLFIPWDIVKTYLEVWGFNPRYLLGFYIGNLPLEEWMFFIAIPYACLFTYHSLNYLVKKDYLGKYADRITLVLAIVLLVIGLLNTGRLYTSVTFISTGIFLMFHRFVVKGDYMGRFYLMYLVTLFPFFIVNGLLTGSIIPEEVVFYDNTQNLGIRLGTIPVEDMVYGLLMLLMNVSWFEFFRNKFKSPVNTVS